MRIGTGINLLGRCLPTSAAIIESIDLSQNLPTDFALYRSSSGTYQDSDGYWHSVSSNTARHGYLFGQGPGLLCESAKTNKVKYARPSSGTTTDHFTINYGATITTDSNNPAKFLSNGTNVWQANAIGSDMVCVFSGQVGNTNYHTAQIYVKVISGTGGYICSFGTGAAGVNLFDSGNNEWQLVTGTWQPTATDHELAIVFSSGTLAEFCFANFQESLIPTSFIDDSGISSTRASDVITSTVSYLGEKNSIEVSYIDVYNRSLNGASQQAIMFISDGTLANCSYTYKTTNGDIKQYTTKAWTDAFSSTTAHNAAMIASGKHVLCHSWDANSQQITLDGAEILSAISSPMVTSGLNTIQLGNVAGSNIIDAIFTNFTAWKYNISLAKRIDRGRYTQLPNTSFNDNLNIVLCHGQSNTTGTGTVLSSSPSLTNISRLKNIKMDGSLAAYAEPYADITGYPYAAYLDNPDPRFAYAGTLIDDICENDSDTNSLYATLPVTEGASDISEKWTCGKVSGNVTRMSERFYILCQRLFLARQYGNIILGTFDFGPSDSLLPVTDSAYITQLKKQIDAIRTYSGLSTLKFIMTIMFNKPIGLDGSYPTNTWDDLQTAQESFIYSNVLTIETESIPRQGDNLHFTETGQITLGHNMANLL